MNVAHDALLAAITRALDALEDGDAREAVEILLAATAGIPIDQPLKCRFCARRFAWAGELEGHEVRSHPWELVDVEAVDVAA
jgi:hypothetical protein